MDTKSNTPAAQVGKKKKHFWHNKKKHNKNQNQNFNSSSGQANNSGSQHHKKKNKQNKQNWTQNTQRSGIWSPENDHIIVKPPKKKIHKKKFFQKNKNNVTENQQDNKQPRFWTERKRKHTPEQTHRHHHHATQKTEEKKPEKVQETQKPLDEDQIIKELDMLIQSFTEPAEEIKPKITETRPEVSEEGTEPVKTDKPKQEIVKHPIRRKKTAVKTKEDRKKPSDKKVKNKTENISVPPLVAVQESGHKKDENKQGLKNKKTGKQPHTKKPSQAWRNR